MQEKKLYELVELLSENGGPFPLSRAGLYKACATGKIPTVRVGRRIFIPAWWVDELLSKPDIKHA